MNWIQLTEKEALSDIAKKSNEIPQVLFKHSTRCSISATALNRFEKSYEEAYGERAQFYFIDLLKYRPVSNAIASEFNVEHQSPQVLVIKNGNCVFHSSHFDIDLKEVMTVI